MHKTYAQYKQRLILDKTSSMLWGKSEETTNSVTFQSILNPNRTERFTLEQELSQQLTTILNRESCIVICKDRPNKTYYVAVSRLPSPGLYEGIITISPTFELDMDMFARNSKGRKIPLLAESAQQSLRTIKREILHLLLQDNTMRLAVVSGAMHSADYDLLSMIK